MGLWATLLALSLLTAALGALLVRPDSDLHPTRGAAFELDEPSTAIDRP